MPGCIYHKINTIYKRDENKRLMLGQYSCPEFEYLKDCTWIGTEKVDGTNIRVQWIPSTQEIHIGGKTDNAQIPVFLYEKLQATFTLDCFAKLTHTEGLTEITLYGEGYGARIQKGGGNYIPNGVDFVLFDVLIGDWWLKRESCEQIAQELGLRIVPITFKGTLADACCAVQKGMKSTWGEFIAEGLVLRPEVELKDRAGHRIITKIKTKDFAFTV